MDTIATPALVFIGTLLVGPFAFWLTSAKYHKHAAARRFPTSVKGSVGDTIMLPFFNARLAQLLLAREYAVSFGLAWAILGATAFLSLAYLYYRKAWVPRIYREDWMNGDCGLFNLSGWYHFGYFIIQVYLILIAFVLFRFDAMLLLFLAGYGLTALGSHLQVKK